MVNVVSGVFYLVHYNEIVDFLSYQYCLLYIIYLKYYYFSVTVNVVLSQIEIKQCLHLNVFLITG